MPFVLAHDRTLHITRHPPAAFRAGAFKTPFDQLNSILPAHAFARASVHELLYLPHHPPPYWLAFQIARQLLHQVRRRCGQLIWFDADRLLNPAALFFGGLSPHQLLVIRPTALRDLFWAVRQCLASPATAAVVAPVAGKLAPATVRQLQLAAEVQSDQAHAPIALLLRPFDQHAKVHAAASRLLVEPAPTDCPITRRWKVRLIHGHGGLLHQPILLERHHEPCLFPAHLLRSSPDLPDRPGHASSSTGPHALAG